MARRGGSCLGQNVSAGDSRAVGQGQSVLVTLHLRSGLPTLAYLRIDSVNTYALLLGLLLCLDTLFLFKSCDSFIVGDSVTLTAFLFLLTAQLGIARGIDTHNAVPCSKASLRVGNLLIVLGEVALILLGCLALCLRHGHGRTFQFGCFQRWRFLFQCLKVSACLLNLRHSYVNSISLTPDSLN